VANKTRFSVVLPQIIKELKSLNVSVFDQDTLNDVFDAGKDKWRLPLRMTARDFITSLVKEDFLNHILFEFNGMPAKILFYLGEVSVYELSAAIFPRSYLSHYAAISLWGLSEQIPKTIYITQEQSNGPAKSKPVKLEQENIDKAFGKPQRESETFDTFQDYKIVFLRGKHTKDLGVEKLGISGKDQVKVTDIERTLIDIAVRPAYSGGVHEVLKAFRQAKEQGNVSINKLSGYLSRMNFIYPYHQAIGFYLEAAGNYKASQIDIFRNKVKDFDFYLTYEMQDMAYSKQWKLYYPKGLV